MKIIIRVRELKICLEIYLFNRFLNVMWWVLRILEGLGFVCFGIRFVVIYLIVILFVIELDIFMCRYF